MSTSSDLINTPFELEPAEAQHQVVTMVEEQEATVHAFDTATEAVDVLSSAHINETESQSTTSAATSSRQDASVDDNDPGSVEQPQRTPPAVTSSRQDASVDDDDDGPVEEHQTVRHSQNTRVYIKAVYFTKTGPDESLLTGREFVVDTSGSVMAYSGLTEEDDELTEASVDGPVAPPNRLSLLVEEEACDFDTKTDAHYHKSSWKDGNDFKKQTKNTTTVSLLSRGDSGKQKVPSVVFSEDSSMNDSVLQPDARQPVILKQPPVVEVESLPPGLVQLVRIYEYVKTDLDESLRNAKEQLKSLYSSLLVRGVLVAVCTMFLLAATSNRGAATNIKGALVILSMAPAYVTVQLEAAALRDPEAEHEEEARLAKFWGLDKSPAPTEPSDETFTEDSSVDEEDDASETPSQPVVVQPSLSVSERLALVCEYVKTDLYDSGVTVKEEVKLLYASSFVCRSVVATLWMCIVRFRSHHPAGLTINATLTALLMATFPMEESELETAIRLEREAAQANTRIQLEEEAIERARLHLEKLKAKKSKKLKASVSQNSNGSVVQTSLCDRLSHICEYVRGPFVRGCEYTTTRVQAGLAHVCEYVKTDVEESLVNAKEELEAINASKFSRPILVGLFLLFLFATFPSSMARDVTKPPTSGPGHKMTLPVKKKPPVSISQHTTTTPSVPAKKPPIFNSQPQQSKMAPMKKPPTKKPPLSTASRPEIKSAPAKTVPAKKPPVSTSQPPRKVAPVKTVPAKKPPVSTSQAERKTAPVKKVAAKKPPVSNSGQRAKRRRLWSS